MPEELSNIPVPPLQPSASYSFTMRLHMPQHGGAFARIARAIADAEAMLGAIDLVRVESHEVVRDVTVACVDSAHAEAPQQSSHACLVPAHGLRARGKVKVFRGSELQLRHNADTLSEGFSP